MADVFLSILSTILLVAVVRLWYEHVEQKKVITKLAAHLDEFTKSASESLEELTAEALRTRMGVGVVDGDLDAYRRQTMNDEIHMMKTNRDHHRSSLRSH